MHADPSVCSYCGGPFGPDYEPLGDPPAAVAVDTEEIDAAPPPRGADMPYESDPEGNGDGVVGEQS